MEDKYIIISGTAENIRNGKNGCCYAIIRDNVTEIRARNPLTLEEKVISIMNTNLKIVMNELSTAINNR